jgi:tetratricopeptide (TPR) repeat protein
MKLQSIVFLFAFLACSTAPAVAQDETPPPEFQEQVQEWLKEGQKVLEKLRKELGTLGEKLLEKLRGLGGEKPPEVQPVPEVPFGNNTAFERARQEAEKAYLARNWKEAKSAAKRAIEIRPDQAMMELLRKVNTKIAGEAVKRGDALQATGNNLGAIREYDAALEENPRFARAYHRRGVANSALGRFQAAIKDQSTAISLDPLMSKAYHYRGKNHFLLKNHLSAIQDYSRAIELDRNNPDIYMDRGIAYNGMRNSKKAIEDFTRVIQLDPTFALAYNLRGRTQLLQGKTEEAIADLTRAINLDPKQEYAWYYRGEARSRKGDDKGAIADYTRTLELDPRNTRAWFNRAYLRRNMGDLDGAIADYTRAIQLDPKYTRAWNNRGYARSTNGDLKGALSDQVEALKLNPSDRGTRLTCGYLRYDLGEWKTSLKDFEEACKAVRRTPNSSSDYASLRIWIIQARLGDRVGATERLRGYAQVRKGTADKWWSKIAEFLVGDLAQEAFLAATSADDQKIQREQECEAYFYVGMKLLVEDDREAARNFFRKCVATDVRNYTEYRSSKSELKRLGE